ncbi:hypothetical protein [Novosphingobium sp. SG720]|uniref:hypothetical protein n=1 Tax=Novosphingobium sp. SG720 TaxID=2586998 RepID=UPI00144773AC|nr:hypothetical protein [Novosphingobium sp. SG720]NKJ44472.1 hypothetical protein [Novosphingobium sp. SG720]
MATFGASALAGVTWIASQPLWLTLFVGLATLALLLIIFHRLEIWSVHRKLRIFPSPRLQANLESYYLNGDTSLKFIIENLGPGDVTILEYEQTSETDFIGSDYIESNRFLPERGKISINSLPLLVRDNPKSVGIRFNFRSMNSSRIFTAQYEFSIPERREISITSPHVWAQHDGASVSQKNIDAGLYKSFLSEEGSIAFTLIKNENREISNILELKGSHGGFFCDLDHGVFIFERKVSNCVKTIKLQYHVEKDWCFVAFVWNDVKNEMRLHINDTVSSDPEITYLIS